jgi:PP-loop superfamily ATP-utilizing enzyme
MTAYHTKVIADAKAVLERQKAERLARLELIVEVVAEVWGTTAEKIMVKRPGCGVKNTAKLVAQFMAVECGFSAPEIGDYFGCDRANTHHGIKWIREAVRIGEAVELLRQVLHKHSEIFKEPR